MRARTLCLLTLLLLLAGGPICEPTPTSIPLPPPVFTPTTTPRPPVTLRWNLGWEPDNIDPVQVFSTEEVDVARQLFVGLTAYDPKTSEPIPDLATHWDVDDSGQVYTFHLRCDVQWVRYQVETGRVEAIRPVTAHDVVYGIRRAIDPRVRKAYVYELHIIRNAITIPDTGNYDFETLGVTAVDEHTVRFTLEEPAAYLPAILALPVTWPAPREAVETYGEQWTEPKHIITNGPYVLAEWTPGKQLTLVKNPLYFQADHVQIERVECTMIRDPDAALSSYERGDLDTLPVWSYRDLVTNPTLAREIHQGAARTSSTYYYVFNGYKPPFDNVHVRRAFSYAIDRANLVATVLPGYGIPANALAPPSVVGNAANDPSTGVYFDPVKAQSELSLADTLPDRDSQRSNCSIGHGINCMLGLPKPLQSCAKSIST